MLTFLKAYCPATPDLFHTVATMMTDANYSSFATKGPSALLPLLPTSTRSVRQLKPYFVFQKTSSTPSSAKPVPVIPQQQHQPGTIEMDDVSSTDQANQKSSNQYPSSSGKRPRAEDDSLAYADDSVWITSSSPSSSSSQPISSNLPKRRPPAASSQQPYSPPQSSATTSIRRMHAAPQSGSKISSRTPPHRNISAKYFVDDEADIEGDTAEDYEEVDNPTPADIDVCFLHFYYFKTTCIH